MHQKLKNLHERYYQKTKLQKRVIEKKNFTYRLILDFLDSQLRNREKILDIGCGTGALSFYMAAKGKHVKGIDVSSRAISACKLNAKNLNLDDNVSFQVADFLKMKTNEYFDLILCISVLEHLADDRLALKKVFKLLKEGGVIFIFVPSQKAPLSRLGFSKKFDRDVGHLRRYDLHQIVNLLENANFNILKTKKVEGIFRDFLFVSKIGSQVNRLANRFSIISDIFTFLDNITLKLFGESQIIVVAQKPKKK